MRHLEEPQQSELFDPWALVFPERLYKRLRDGWQGLFHDVILKLMPAAELAEAFHPALGRPTKELYSMAGIVFLKEFHDWTEEEAVDAYCFHSDIRYALHIDGDGAIGLRTLERYIDLFRKLGLAGQVFDDVTRALIERLELDLRKQRGDSTHVYSNMAMYGRTALMAKALEKFLAQVLRHHRARYEALPAELRERYAKPKGAKPFGLPRAQDTAEERRRVRQQVAEDRHVVLQFYDGEVAITNKYTYKQLLRVFEEHCAVVEDAVEVRKKTGARALQSVSDPGATYDGHKGRGYQAQVTETCSENNAVQLITDVIPQTAADSDSESLPEMVERLEAQGRKPEELYADAAYGSDENVLYCGAKDIELVVPAKKRQKGSEGTMDTLDFEIDAQTLEVTQCPEGHTPCSARYNEEKDDGFALFESQTCEACPERERCPAYQYRNHYRFNYSKKRRRLDQRRRAQQTPEFKKRYSIRAGVEGLMSALKRGRGFGRLRIRGRPAVNMVLYLKAAAHNILQAARCIQQRAKDPSKKTKAQKMASFLPEYAASTLGKAIRKLSRGLPRFTSTPNGHRGSGRKASTLFPKTLLAG